MRMLLSATDVLLKGSSAVALEHSGRSKPVTAGVLVLRRQPLEKALGREVDLGIAS